MAGLERSGVAGAMKLFLERHSTTTQEISKQRFFEIVYAADMLKLAIVFALAVASTAMPTSDPYGSLTPAEVRFLKPEIERWILDQVKHDWTDMGKIQEQTSELKNALLLGRRDAPDMDQKQYVQRMRVTMGLDYPEIKAFTLRDVQRESGGFRVVGCGRLQRETWKQTSITFVHVNIVNDKAMFGLPKGTPDSCKL